ncbi:hypothetical protein KM043_003695 [Ampulex compressa]|nr:hypothetical protein KM043_003695 [Ampulex compressa]
MRFPSRLCRFRLVSQPKEDNSEQGCRKTENGGSFRVSPAASLINQPSETALFHPLFPPLFYRPKSPLAQPRQGHARGLNSSSSLDALAHWRGLPGFDVDRTLLARIRNKID